MNKTLSKLNWRAKKTVAEYQTQVFLKKLNSKDSQSLFKCYFLYRIDMFVKSNENVFSYVAESKVHIKRFLYSFKSGQILKQSIVSINLIWNSVSGVFSSQRRHICFVIYVTAESKTT